MNSGAKYSDTELNAILGGRRFSLQFDEHGNAVIYEVTMGVSSDSDLASLAVGKWLSRWVEDSFESQDKKEIGNE